MTSRVYYLCDKRACDKCDDNCEYTSDIKHAVNFEVSGLGAYFEIKQQEQERIPIDWIVNHKKYPTNKEKAKVIEDMIADWREGK